MPTEGTICHVKLVKKPKREKRSEKSEKRGCQKGWDVVLYSSAKGRRKEWLLESGRSKAKEPIWIRWKTGSQVRKNRKASEKKCLTKNHFCGKIIKSSAAKLRRTGPWKLNNIEKLVTEPIKCWKNTLNNSKQSNSHRTQAIACWAKKI